MFVYGAGGFGTEVVDSVRRINRSSSIWDEVCFIDDTPGKGPRHYGAAVHTLDSVREQFDPEECEVVIANGEPLLRKSIWDKVISSDFRFATIVDMTSIISDTADVGDGVVVTPYCSVSSSAVVGNNVVLNSKAIVGHDVKLGEHCVISSLVCVGGASTVGEGSYIGMGVQIRDGITIGKNTIVGMGSVVTNDLPAEVIALGNPARPMKKNIDRIVFPRSNKGFTRE